MKSQCSFSVRAGVYVLAVAVLAMGLTACGGGSSTPPTTTQPPVAQTGLQIQNSAFSIYQVTQICTLNLGTAAQSCLRTTVFPGSTGPVISLATGTYEYWVEYDSGAGLFWTNHLVTTVSQGQVTFETIIVQ